MTEPVRPPESPSPRPAPLPQRNGLPLPLERLLPMGAWLEVLKLPLMRGVLLFALLPLGLVIYFTNYIEITLGARILGLYFAVLWGYVLMHLLGFFQLKARNLLVPIVFTPAVGISLVLLLQQFPGFNLLYGATEVNAQAAQLVGFVLGVGVLEEAVKILPIVWLCYSARAIQTPREAAFYAGVSGLAFGVAESAMYIRTFGADETLLASGNYIILGVLRLTTLPLLHAAFSGLFGYYVGLGISRPQSRRTLLLFGLAVSAVIHGLYDFVNGWATLLVAAFAIVAFVGTARKSES